MFSRNRQPETRYESDTSILALLGAAGIGAALMYFLDPDSGRRRRALVKDQVTHYKAVGLQKTEALVHQAANQTRGVIAKAQDRLASKEEPINDPLSSGPASSVN
jgi:hypothetical protein